MWALHYPNCLAFDSQGDRYFAGNGNSAIRKIWATITKP